MYALLQSVSPTLQQATTDSCLRRRLPNTHRQVSYGVTAPFSWVLVHKVLLCPPRVYFPVLCEFWQLYGGVNGDLLPEDLCHTDTQSPCPCGRPLPTRTSTGDAHSSVSVSVGSPGPGAHKVCLSPLSISGVSLTLDVGYLLTAAAPDLGRGVSPLGRWPLQH